MSLLNLTNDGLPSVLTAVVRYLEGKGATEKGKLLSILAPESVGSSAMLRSTITRWTQLSLFTEEDGLVGLSEHIRGKRPSERLAFFARDLALKPENNQDLWGTGGSADFTRALSWALAQEVVSLQGNAKEVEKLSKDQNRGKRKIFQNHTRWPGFIAWARFFGFGWEASFMKSFVVEPSVAIASFLDEILPEDQEMPIDTFLGSLAERCPVLDGGLYRKEIEAQLAEDAWRRPDADQLSSSLSLGLESLERQGRIRFLSKDDAPIRKRLAGPERQQCTHISLIPRQEQ